MMKELGSAWYLRTLLTLRSLLGVTVEAVGWEISNTKMKWT
jgi:hypothetical protein